MTNPKRNHPCPCGSGRKYKKCCGKENAMEEGKTIVTPHSLNETAKESKSPLEIEAEKVGDPEMLRRDQYVTMRQLQVQKQMSAEDIAYTEKAIESYKMFLAELSEQPMSQAREAVVGLIDGQIKQLEQQAKQSAFKRVNLVTLSALEEKFMFEPPDDDDEPEELRDD